MFSSILSILVFWNSISLSRPYVASTPAVTPESTTVTPTEFNLLLSAPGVELYVKEYAGGNPDYIQVIDLGQGAKIELLQGGLQDLGAGKGAFGGNDASFYSKTLQQYWNEFAHLHNFPFCVTNGAFFYMREYPTRLPFSLKIDEIILTDGYGKNDFPDKKLMLSLWDDQADITSLTSENFYQSTAPNVIGGLAEDAPKSPNKYVARTFVGIKDKDGDSQFETVLIFNTLTARQVDAASALRSLGAEKVMMLDGGGSTQLVCENVPYIEFERLVPQAIGVLAAGPAPEKLLHKPTIAEFYVEATELSKIKTRTSKQATLTPHSENQSETVLLTPSPTLNHEYEPRPTRILHDDRLEKTHTASTSQNQGKNLLGAVWVIVFICVIAPIIFIQVNRRQ